jgi:hypothetical protein
MVLGSQFTVHSPGGIKRHIGRRRGRTAGTRRGMCGGVVSASLCGCGGEDTARRTRHAVSVPSVRVWGKFGERIPARVEGKAASFTRRFTSPPHPLSVYREGESRGHGTPCPYRGGGGVGADENGLACQPGRRGAGIGVVGDGGRPIGRPYRFVSTRDFG